MKKKKIILKIIWPPLTILLENKRTMAGDSVPFYANQPVKIKLYFCGEISRKKICKNYQG